MKNEETIVVKQQNAQLEQTNKTKGNEGSSKLVAATAAAGAFGGVVGGAGSVAAANMMNRNDEEIEIVEEQVEGQVEEQTTQSTKENVASAQSIQEKQTSSENEIEDITFEGDDELDYTNVGGADPVVDESILVTDKPSMEDTSMEEESTVQVLGVYDRTTDDGIYQEVAILTDGEEIAAVLDVDGDGIVDLLAVDENLNGEFEEGEIHDVSDENVSMSMYEEAYLAQQQEEQQQAETFVYQASDETDYNNDVETYEV